MRGLYKKKHTLGFFYNTTTLNYVYLYSALEVHAKALEFQSGVVIVDKEFTPINNVPKSITFPEAGTGTIRWYI